MQPTTFIVALLLAAGPASATGGPTPYGWPPETCVVDPFPASSTDQITITLGGSWPTSCVPDSSQATVSGTTILFDLGLPPDPFCLYVITSWARSETVGPLAGGTYTVIATLFDDEGAVVEGPTPVCLVVVETRCPWDLNGDGVVNVLDLVDLVMSIGPCGEECPADFDGDGFVTALDLVALLLNLGPCPGFAECPWDLDGDGVVGPSDLQLLLQNLGPCEDPENCPWDFNGDGVVDVADQQELVHNFGPCPSGLAGPGSDAPSQAPDLGIDR